MPKIAVAIIFAAFGWIFGFGLGALFTKPQNTEMEKLLKDKNELLVRVSKSEQNATSLNTQIKDLEIKNLSLKERLLKAYQKIDETEKAR